MAIVFINTAFVSVDRPVLWHYCLRGGNPEKDVSVFRELYRHTSSRFKASFHHPSLFPAEHDKATLLPSPLTEFGKLNVLQVAVSGLLDDGIILLPSCEDFDFYYANDITLLSDSASYFKRFQSKIE